MKKGVIFKLENKDGYHFFKWVREPGSEPDPKNVPMTLISFIQYFWLKITLIWIFGSFEPHFNTNFWTLWYNQALVVIKMDDTHICTHLHEWTHFIMCSILSWYDTDTHKYMHTHKWRCGFYILDCYTLLLNTNGIYRWIHSCLLHFL